jgi:hypothetical protein
LFAQAEGVRSTTTEQFWATESSDGHVTDASLSARERGVRRGMPIRTAKALIPELVSMEEVDGVPPGLEKILSTVLAFTPWIEVAGKDSFYFQLPGTRPPLQEIRKLLERVNRQLTEEQRIQVGLAELPKLARAVVEWNKVEHVPDALYWRVGRQLWLVAPSLAQVVTGRQRANSNWVLEMPIPAFWDVPADAQERLTSLGVYRFSELCTVPVSYLKRQFGENALVWLQFHRSVPQRLQVNYPLRKLTKEWVADLGEEVPAKFISDLVRDLVSQLAEDLHRSELGALKLGLVWKSNHGIGSYERAVKQPVYQPEYIFAAVESGFSECNAEELSFVQLYALDIQPLVSMQLALSEQRPEEKRGTVDVVRVVRHVNRKFPDSLRMGIRPSFRELRLQAVLKG